MKVKSGQRLPFKRRLVQKTDYSARFKLLKSGLPRLVVRRGNDNIHIQVVRYDAKGDKTVAEEISRNLKKLGWKGHCGNLPAAYLTGFMLGKKAAGAGISNAVLDIGLQMSTKGSAIYAAVKGAKDAGISIAIGEEILPDAARISGGHINAEIAKNFEEVKKKITETVK